MSLKLWWSDFPRSYWKSAKEPEWSGRWPLAGSPRVAFARAAITHLSFLDSPTLMGLFMGHILVMSVPQKPLTLAITRLWCQWSPKPWAISEFVCKRYGWWETHMTEGRRRWKQLGKGGVPTSHLAPDDTVVSRRTSPPNAPQRLPRTHPMVWSWSSYMSQECSASSGKHDTGHKKATALTDVFSWNNSFLQIYSDDKKIQWLKHGYFWLKRKPNLLN